ncbi:palmitoyltransferase AKR1 [Rhizoctonia solani AG-1 IA]|uniref:protein S-acyltransferase n=1 Tax=Thanatephorus cucumeris (strain AG1-IA) TaxID=983506 RepID=L8WP51_THACA|nr:palmitoyltransferase AKR1 [Rhizoctonia solani AG-1 IA]
MSELAGFSSKGTAVTAVTADNASAADVAHNPTATIQVPEEGDETNIFLAAQRGDVPLLQSLISRGLASAADRDSQNVTPLHWAAINAQLAACEYLIQAGAEVDAVGGELVSTPLQWAARNGYIYIIQLLLQHGADPSICDAQGYNTLHLVTHSSGVMAVLYMLQHLDKVPIDSQDSAGHTALMWAAYQGDALSVDLLLKHGAKVSAVDAVGLTPLHWSVVRGNRMCIRRLVESGADLNARSQDGKTARDMAVELKSIGAWRKALEEGGFEEDGRKSAKPLNEVGILTDSPNQIMLIVLPAKHETRCLTYAHPLPDHSLAHLLYFVSASLCAYNFFRSITLDPGTCARPGSAGEMKAASCPLTPVDFHFALDTQTPTPTRPPSPSCILPTELCALTAAHTFILSLALWATLQLSWTVILLAGQLWQITRQMTTLEVSNLGRYGFMGGKGGTSLSEQHGHSHNHSHSHGAGGHGHKHKLGGCCGGIVSAVMSLTGLERYTKFRAGEGLKRAKSARNPFSLGVVANCTDFWTAGKTLGVDYRNVWDVPPEGFLEAKRRRGDDHEDWNSGAGGGKLMGRLRAMMGQGAASRGYEPVRMSEGVAYNCASITHAEKYP